MTKADILPFTGVTRLDIAPAKVLKGAREAKLSEVMVIGYDAHGDFWFSSSRADGADVLWLLEKAKRKLFEMADAMERGQ